MNFNLQLLFDHIQQEMMSFSCISLYRIYRDKNKAPNGFSKEALGLEHGT